MKKFGAEAVDYPYVAAPILLNNLQQKPVLQAMKATGRIATTDTDSLIVRIAEIEVHPEYLEEYLASAKTIGAESVAKESGVICIFPMIQQRDSCQIRILEIYANKEAYQSHLQTPHFQTYKQGTLHMVKSLDLIDVKPMNAAGMWEIFKKMQ